ncbi:MAG: branched-chain amino acid ABC transporter permease [Thermoleophilia bacterium]|nr:branched-chain amino acid ABC transporter permease [Thermoleophilia bacterium]
MLVLVVSSPVIVDLGIMSGYYLLLTGSWNLLAGFTGQFSFAHAGLAAVGAYLTVWLETGVGLGAAPSLPLAAAMTAIIGLALGTVSLRVRGIYLALITFAFGGAFTVWLTGARDLTGGASGHPTEFLFTGVDQKPFLWLVLGLVVAYFLTQAALVRSRFGLQATAVRDREEVAEGLGVRTTHVKIGMFTFTAFWAGLAGSFYAGYIGIVAPSIGGLNTMGLIVAMAVVGAMGRTLGPIAGVLALQLISYQVRGFGAEYTMLIFSALVLIVMFFARDGLLGISERALRRLRPRAGRWEGGTSSDSTAASAALAEPAPRASAMDPPATDRRQG